MTGESVVQEQGMSNYSLHKAILNIAQDFKYAFDNGDLGLAIKTIEGDLATAYVVAKELEEHGYEAFCAVINELNRETPE